MKYKDNIMRRISELEEQIVNNFGEKHKLEAELQKLLKQEFEESLREESEQSPRLLQE